MNKYNANEICNIIRELDKQLHMMTEISMKFEDQEEGKILRRHIAHVIAYVDKEVLRPVVREHPDLDIDK